MKKIIIFLLLLPAFIQAQVKISELPTYSGSAENGYVPATIGAATYKVFGKQFAAGKLDSIQIVTRAYPNADSLFEWKAGVRRFRSLLVKQLDTTNFARREIYTIRTMPTIGADANYVMPTPTDTSKEGRIMVLNNANTSAFEYTLTGATVKEADGTTITVMPNGTLSLLYWNGTAWIRLSSGGAPGGAPDPYFAGFGLLLDVPTKTFSLDTTITQSVDFYRAGDSIGVEIGGVFGKKVYAPISGGTVTAASDGVRLDGSTVKLENSFTPRISDNTVLRAAATKGIYLSNDVGDAALSVDDAAAGLGNLNGNVIQTTTTYGQIAGRSVWRNAAITSTSNVDLSNSVNYSYFPVIKLTGTLSANRTLTLPSGYADNEWCTIFSTNGSAFKWQVAGASVYELDGTAITEFENNKTYDLIWNSAASRWQRKTGGAGGGGGSTEDSSLFSTHTYTRNQSQWPVRSSTVTTPSGTNYRSDFGSAVVKGDTIFAAYTSYGAGAGDADTARIIVKYSLDKGITWSSGDTAVAASGTGVYIPSMYLRADGSIVMLYLRKNSTTTGQIYKKERSVAGVWGAGASIYGDGTGYYAPAGDRILKTKKGRLLYPFNYNTNGTLTSALGNYRGKMLTSVDDGTTWTLASGVDVGSPDSLCAEPGVFQTNEATAGIYYYYRTRSGDVYYNQLTDSSGLTSAASQFPIGIFAQNSTSTILFDESSSALIAAHNRYFSGDGTRALLDLSVGYFKASQGDYVNTGFEWKRIWTIDSAATYTFLEPTLLNYNNEIYVFYSKQNTAGTQLTYLMKKFPNTMFAGGNDRIRNNLIIDKVFDSKSANFLEMYSRGISRSTAAWKLASISSGNLSFAPNQYSKADNVNYGYLWQIDNPSVNSSGAYLDLRMMKNGAKIDSNLVAINIKNFTTSMFTMLGTGAIDIYKTVDGTGGTYAADFLDINFASLGNKANNNYRISNVTSGATAFAPYIRVQTNNTGYGILHDIRTTGTTGVFNINGSNNGSAWANTIDHLVLQNNGTQIFSVTAGGSVKLRGGASATGSAPIKFSTTHIASTSISANGTTATLNFSIQNAIPFVVGSTIVVTGATPSGYNGTYVVTAATTSSVSYANTTTGAQTVSAKISGVLANPEDGALEYDGTEQYFTNSTAVRGTVQVNRSLVSSAGTLTLATTYSDYIFSGTTTTWTLPAVTGTGNHVFYIKNRGSGSITLNTTASANEIYDTSATNTLTITAGSSLMLRSDGTYFNKF